MLSVGKIFWLLVILAIVWYGFKIIDKRKTNAKQSNNNKDNVYTKGLDAYECDICGIWSPGDSCQNYKCTSKNQNK